MAEEKQGISGATHLQLGDDVDQDATLEAAGLYKVEEKEIKARNADFAAAIGDKPPNPWGRGYLQLYCMCFVVYLCSTMNGYDGSLMGSINSVTEYQSYYGLPLNGASSTGIVFAIFQIGQMAGAFFVWIADWKGRKLPIFLGCFGVIIGTIITATAKNLSTFVGGRFLLSFFCTWATTSAPILVIELAPPQFRATVSGLFNTLWYMGSIIASFAVYGSNLHQSDNLTWRLPLWLQMLCPGIVCIFIYFVPESPRWLIAADRHEEARAFLVKHHANGDADHPIVEMEMKEIIYSLQTTELLSWRNFFDIRDLLNTRARRYRTGLNFSFSWFGQFSGNNVISYYLPLLLAQVGITNPNTQILLNAVYASTGWIAATAGARFHDVLGRRIMFMGSTIGMVVCLSIAAGGAAGFVNTGSVPASDASISFIYVFGVVFAFAYTSMQPIYPAEVMTNDMRAKGMFLFQWTAGCAGFINTFVAPIALKNIGYWFYVFFVFWDCIELAIICFFFVETKGRTLEQLDEVFTAKNPRKASTLVVKMKTTRLIDEKGKESVAVDQIEDIGIERA